MQPTCLKKLYNIWYFRQFVYVRSARLRDSIFIRPKHWLKLNQNMLVINTNVYLKSPLEVNLVHQIPIFIWSFSDCSIPKNSGVIDNDIDTTEVIDCSLNKSIAVLYWIIIGYGFTPWKNYIKLVIIVNMFLCSL